MDDGKKDKTKPEDWKKSSCKKAGGKAKVGRKHVFTSRLFGTLWDFKVTKEKD